MLAKFACANLAAKFSVVNLAKLVILGISSLTSFILALRVLVVLVAKLVISGILSSIFFILALYTSFLTTPFFAMPLNLL